MILQVFSVYDRAAGAFMQPFFARSRAEAMRSFTDAVGQKDTPFCVHPEDFTLMAVGSWDDAAGELKPIVPDKIITGLECRPES